LNSFDDGICQLPIFRRRGKLINMNQMEHD
jgi:hypothetical protein